MYVGMCLVVFAGVFLCHIAITQTTVNQINFTVVIVPLAEFVVIVVTM